MSTAHCSSAALGKNGQVGGEACPHLLSSLGFLGQNVGHGSDCVGPGIATIKLLLGAHTGPIPWCGHIVLAALHMQHGTWSLPKNGGGKLRHQVKLLPSTFLEELGGDLGS